MSAHDAGAFYSYERLTGTFEYHSQETRKGILQQPTFPKTVITSGNHPVLFAAEGSHGLWTAPGKHKFVRVPRLYDINGFGMPWSTWRNVELIHENDAKGKITVSQSRLVADPSLIVFYCGSCCRTQLVATQMDEVQRALG